MDVFSHTENGVCILSLSGPLVRGEAEQKLGRGFAALLGSGERTFVFHLADVPYVDSAGIGELVACAKRAYEHGGVIKIVLPPGGRTHDIFRIASLDKVFEIFPQADQALASFFP